MVFGEYEYVIIDLDKLVVLPQVRKKKNEKIDEMADSIEDRGLINPLDVARLNKEELQSHINFISSLWRENIDINSFLPIDGFYYVVIAGHTRLDALRHNAKTHNRKDQVSIKIHPVKSSEEILAIQLDENIHSEPKIEERAIAIIETYRLGIEIGRWNNKEEFIKKNKNKFSRRILNDALLFADLPLEAQEYVFARNIPYNIGVELGRVKPLIRKYEADFEEIESNIEKNIKLHYGRLLIKIQNAKSKKRALSIIEAHCKNLNDHFRPKEDLQQEMFEWLMSSPDRQAEIHKKEQIAEHNKLCVALNRLPFEYYMELLSLDTNLTGIDNSEDLAELRRLYSQFINPKFFETKLNKRKR